LEKKVEELLRLLPASGDAPATPVGRNVVPENDEQEEGFAVFPNPTKDEITVVFNLKSDAEVSVSILDASDKLVRQNALGRLAAGKHSAAIDLSQVPNGNYFICAMLDGKPVTKNIAVQH
jgi:flagellar hook assembly protein FlgD